MCFCMHHIRMMPRANNYCLPKYYHPLSLCNRDSVCNVKQELKFVPRRYKFCSSKGLRC
jgi:hypothetical protein